MTPHGPGAPRADGRLLPLSPRNGKRLKLRTPVGLRACELRGLTDEALMHRVDAADALAFEVIFDRHAGAAFSLAYRMCGRRSVAEDIVQETFLSLWRRGGRFDRARGSVRFWVLGAVRNKAIDSFRHETAKSGREVNDDAAAEGIAARERTDREVERRDDARQVRDALGQLPAEQRRVIELAYFGGFTHTEIAQMLDTPAGTVKGRMRLGLTRMRLALGDLAEAGAASNTGGLR